MNLQDGHPRVQMGLHPQLGVPVHGFPDQFRVVADVDAGLRQGRAVGRGEGVEGLGAVFGGTVAPEELGVEEDAHFRYAGMALGVLGGGNLHGPYQVLLAVRAGYADGQLASGEHHRFGEPFQHETEGGGTVGHGIRSVKDHESVIVFVAFRDEFPQGGPKRGLYV